jgi:hypothetical protein
MKKSTRWILIFILVSMLIFATGSLASADAPAKGEVIALDEGTSTATVSTKSGEVVVTLPTDFDFTSVALGDILMAKGVWTSETELTADWVKVFPAKGEKPDEGEEEDEDEDGEKPEKEDKEFNSAYCTGEKDSLHPLAYKLAEKFGEAVEVSAEQVQAWYCEGNSIGAIMLALMTEQMGGPPAADTLMERNEGKGWGKIWQELGFIGKEKDGMPPGQLKKQDGKIPPGQLKKTPQP